MSKHFVPVVTITNEAQNRIEKRRSEGLDVLGFVDAIMHGLNEIFTEPARTEADEKARAKAEEREQEKLYEENRRHLTAFWEKHPPASLTTVPNIQTENELFDVLARYHVLIVEYSFSVVYYPWDSFGDIENPSIEAWLAPDIEIDLHTDLPDDGHGIGNAIYGAIERLASERAAQATKGKRLQDGKVIFDVRARRILMLPWQSITTLLWRLILMCN
jgi:hypothetical protein